MSPNSRPRLSLPGLMIAGVALMFAMPLAAQAASYTYINQKAPYKNPHSNGPMLTALNLPKIGTTFQVRVPGTYQDEWSSMDLYYLAFGVSNPNVPIPMLHGFLYSSAEVIVPAPYTPTWGFVRVSFPIPNSPQLMGVRFYQQVLWDYSGCFSGDYYLSRGGVGVIGK